MDSMKLIELVRSMRLSRFENIHVGYRLNAERIGLKNNLIDKFALYTQIKEFSRALKIQKDTTDELMKYVLYIVAQSWSEIPRFLVVPTRIYNTNCSNFIKDIISETNPEIASQLNCSSNSEICSLKKQLFIELLENKYRWVDQKKLDHLISMVGYRFNLNTLIMDLSKYDNHSLLSGLDLRVFEILNIYPYLKILCDTDKSLRIVNFSVGNKFEIIIHGGSFRRTDKCLTFPTGSLDALSRRYVFDTISELESFFGTEIITLEKVCKKKSIHLRVQRRGRIMSKLELNDKSFDIENSMYYSPPDQIITGIHKEVQNIAE